MDFMSCVNVILAVGEHHLDGLLGVLVEELVGLGGLFEGEAVGDPA